MNTKQKKGFTLIELLVVISIIALLLALLMPALAKAKNLAMIAACSGQLKQWGLITRQYTNDNKDLIWMGWRTQHSTRTGDPQWWDSTYNYYKNRDLMFCPAAKVPWDSTGNAPQGSSEKAWGGAWGLSWHETAIPGITPDGTTYGPYNRRRGYYYPKGSYGNSDWVCDKKTGDQQNAANGYSNDNRFWRTVNVKGADKVPSIGDSAWYSFSPLGASPDEAPPDYKDSPTGMVNEMARVCIDRHKGIDEWLFLDSSVRPVGIKELWTLKWHRNYDPKQSIYVWSHYTSPQNPYSQWPAWMQGYKEYMDK